MNSTRWLQGIGSVALATAVWLAPVPSVSADYVRDSQWPLSAFDAESIWDVSTGKGVTVAVIDSGVDASHPDLKGNVLPGKDFIDGGRADRPVEDVHGTSMAGIIAGHGHGPNGSQGVKGLAPDARILPVRTTTDAGVLDPEFFFTESSLPEAVRYAVDQGASVINMSIGFPGKDPEGARAVQYALQKDVVVVASAGNSGTDEPEYPASLPGVVSVGAIGSSGEIWKKSSYGSNVMLSAPGVGVAIIGADGTYRNTNGTSDSAAYVSAAAALLRAKFPDLTAGQIANRLVKSAELPNSAKGRELPDKHYGYGYIRPYTALTADIPKGSVNGPLPAPSPTATIAPGTSAADSGSSHKRTFLFVLAGLGTLTALVLATVLVTVIVKRRRRRPTPAMPYGAAPGPYATTPQQPDAGPPPPQRPYR